MFTMHIYIHSNKGLRISCLGIIFIQRRPSIPNLKHKLGSCTNCRIDQFEESFSKEKRDIGIFVQKKSISFFLSGRCFKAECVTYCSLYSRTLPFRHSSLRAIWTCLFYQIEI